MYPRARGRPLCRAHRQRRAAHRDPRDRVHRAVSRGGAGRDSHAHVRVVNRGRRRLRGRREVPLNPRHTASFDILWKFGQSQLGIEAFYTGSQALEDNPYRTRGRAYVLFGFLFQHRVGPALLYRQHRKSRRRPPDEGTTRCFARHPFATAGGPPTPGRRSTAARSMRDCDSGSRGSDLQCATGGYGATEDTGGLLAMISRYVCDCGQIVP